MNRFSAEHNSMRVVRRPPCFTSMFPTNEVQRKYANISQMFCFRQNSDQFTARTFNDERFAEIFVADALAQTRSITNISVTDDLKVRSVASSVHGPLREQLRPCGRRARFPDFHEVNDCESRSCHVCRHALPWRQIPWQRAQNPPVRAAGVYRCA